MLSAFRPIARAEINNTALPAAEADWLSSAIEPTNSPSYLRIYVCVGVAGILRVRRTTSAGTVTENLNNGANLTANAAHSFDVEWRSGDTINFRYSATGANIICFRVNEIGASTS